MANGRCRLHGGKSTGPRTPEGLERSRRARLVHGYYTAEAKAARAEARRTMRELQLLLREADFYEDADEELGLWLASWAVVRGNQ